jgi:hypothetical protein
MTSDGNIFGNGISGLTTRYVHSWRELVLHPPPNIYGGIKVVPNQVPKPDFKVVFNHAAQFISCLPALPVKVITYLSDHQLVLLLSTHLVI